MTGFRWLSATAFGLILVSGPAPAATFDAAGAKKTCLERYNREKEAGTIPAGMAKSRYMNQCFLSMRQSEQLEQELAAASDTTNAAGSNELAPSPVVEPKPTKGASSKPASVVAPTTSKPKAK